MSRGTAEELLEVLGVTVVDIPDLVHDVAYAPEVRVGMIRAEVSPERRQRCVDYLLSRAEVGA